MKRIFLFLLVFTLTGYGVWPYYTLFRLDNALAEADPQAIDAFVDLPTLREVYKERLGSSMESMVPRAGSESEAFVAWLTEGIQQLSGTALDRFVDLEWVRNLLREAAASATEERPAYLMASVDYAFFESWNRFLIRLGPRDSGTIILMSLQGVHWRITDIDWTQSRAAETSN